MQARSCACVICDGVRCVKNACTALLSPCRGTSTRRGGTSTSWNEGGLPPAAQVSSVGAEGTGGAPDRPVLQASRYTNGRHSPPWKLVSFTPSWCLTCRTVQRYPGTSPVVGLIVSGGSCRVKPEPVDPGKNSAGACSACAAIGTQTSGIRKKLKNRQSRTRAPALTPHNLHPTHI